MSALSNPAALTHQKVSIFADLSIRLSYIVLSTIFQDFYSDLFDACPFRHKIHIIGTQLHRKILPGNWKLTKTTPISAHKRCTTSLAHNIFASINLKVPRYRHGFIGKLLLSYPQLNILLPSMPLSNRRPRLDLILRLRMHPCLFRSIRIFMLGFIVSHHNYNGLCVVYNTKRSCSIIQLAKHSHSTTYPVLRIMLGLHSHKHHEVCRMTCCG